MEKNYILLILTVLILLGIIGYISTIELTPPINQFKNYVISGKVIPSEKISNNRPDYVYAYYPYYNLDNLCGSSEMIKLNEIKWVDDVTGQFQIYFSVPVGLNEIILTTGCDSCNNTKIDLTNTSSAITLKWGEKCEEKYAMSDQNLLPSARHLLTDTSARLAKGPFNDSEKESIQNDLDAGWRMISQSGSGTESNESLLNAHYSEWFALQSSGKERLLELKYCLRGESEFLKQYAGDQCYTPDHKTYEDYKTANSTYTSIGYAFYEREPFDIRDVDSMKQRLTYLDGLNMRLSVLKGNCEGSLRVINETFELQKPYCEARKITFNITYIIWAIVFVYVGIIIEKGRLLWETKK